MVVGGWARKLADLGRGNRYDRWEWAGAFGDIGTLIPFVLAYITLLKIDPVGLLLMFGLAKVAAGFYYRTPVPIQPQKAVGAGALGHPGAFTPEAVWAAGLFSGMVWLVLGLTGAIGLAAKLVRRPVVHGIMLGLGFSFMLEGLKAMQGNWPLAAAALVMTLFLLGNQKFPAMAGLLLLGMVSIVLSHPEALSELFQNFGFQLPHFTLTRLTASDVTRGIFLLGLPQLPLTLGNAVIAIVAENNELFPQRRLTEREVAVSTGLMNLVSPLCGGVPMCHGAGGMAGHVRFGARTGGALVILGSLLIILALFCGRGIALLFQLFPPAVLGTILFFAGAGLALTAAPEGIDRHDSYVTLIIAGMAIWNVGVAFLMGVALTLAMQKGWIRLYPGNRG